MYNVPKNITNNVLQEPQYIYISTRIVPTNMYLSLQLLQSYYNILFFAHWYYCGTSMLRIHKRTICGIDGTCSYGITYTMYYYYILVIDIIYLLNMNFKTNVCKLQCFCVSLFVFLILYLIVSMMHDVSVSLYSVFIVVYKISLLCFMIDCRGTNIMISESQG